MDLVVKKTLKKKEVGWRKKTVASERKQWFVSLQSEKNILFDFYVFNCLCLSSPNKSQSQFLNLNQLELFSQKFHPIHCLNFYSIFFYFYPFIPMFQQDCTEEERTNETSTSEQSQSNFNRQTFLFDER